MLPERYRRLWKRRLRRRPLLPLLLAATLAVDAVLALTDISENLIAAGVLLAQMSLVAVWTVHTLRDAALRAAIGVLMILALIQVFFGISGKEDAVLGPVLLLVFGGKCLAAGIVLLARRATRSAITSRPRWRFSIGSLLLTAVLIALVGTAAQRGEWGPVADPDVLELVFGETVVVFAITALYAFVPRRLSGWWMVGLPIAGLLLIAVAPLSRNSHGVLLYSLVQALAMGVWLAIFAVRAHRVGSMPARSPEPSAEPSDKAGDDGPRLLRLRIDVTV
ncbi:MAG: hypothetical protein AAFV43_10755 [Planctomycetota bacterium]